jgi:hypothetical protein
MKTFLIPLFIFILLLTQVDRRYFKASKGFCLHFIDTPLTPNPAWDISSPFPDSIFDQPFTYLDKGAQSFVFESQDQKYVLKLYKFPSHMRRFSTHPLGYLFSQKRKVIKEHNKERFLLSYNSYFLAHQQLSQETATVYIHLNPTTHLKKHVQLIDNTGYTYSLSLDHFGFVLQQKGTSFIPTLQLAIEQHQIETAKKMIDSLIQLIKNRCSKGITDLDNIANDNYGWLDNHAIHLDIGRFTTQENINPSDEVIRVTQPLSDYLKKTSPELFEYYKTQSSCRLDDVTPLIMITPVI